MATIETSPRTHPSATRHRTPTVRFPARDVFMHAARLRSPGLGRSRFSGRALAFALAIPGLGLGLSLGSIACVDVQGMDPANPQRGPGELVGNGSPITDGNFPGGFDQTPAPRDVDPPLVGPIECDVLCQSYCDDLDLTNPVNQ